MDDRPGDAELIAASLTDPAQFELVFDRHYDAIHRYLARRGGRELAEDLTQSVFLAGFEGRRRFRSSEAASAAPWLFGIATNLLRRHARTELRRFRAYARLPAREVAAFDVNALADRLDAAASAPRAFEIVARLPEGERNALLLVAWADLTYEEVAVALDGARSRAFRVGGGSTMRRSLSARGVPLVEPHRPQVPISEMTAHQPIASRQLKPMSVPRSRPRTVSMIGVNGWNSANTWTGPIDR